jgi:hypothetical protein
VEGVLQPAPGARWTAGLKACATGR